MSNRWPRLYTITSNEQFKMYSVHMLIQRKQQTEDVLTESVVKSVSEYPTFIVARLHDQKTQSDCQFPDRVSVALIGQTKGRDAQWDVLWYDFNDIGNSTSSIFSRNLTPPIRSRNPTHPTAAEIQTHPTSPRIRPY